ncbi:MAG TPA: SIS domain-containing protein [Candidatus Dormibacteraeota bacterium]|nr:SIS domain-containing protein [Candidatus Dormibacteraeota bacterium]
MKGALMAAEMAEQPAVLGSLLQRQAEISDVVRAVMPQRLHGAVLIARGSSDNAALYGRYLLEMVMRRPVSLASPSVHTLYRADVDHAGYLAIAVSQSGQTPEIVSVLERMRASGAHTLAIVNSRDSPLAAVAQGVIELRAGDEHAVPSTKTFTATLLALALMASANGAAPWTQDELCSIPEQCAALLADQARVSDVAALLAGCDRMVAIARGILLAAASETALKIRETTSLFAEAASVADLRHGPIAAVIHGVPVLAFSAPGPGAEDVASMVAELRAKGLPVATISGSEDADLPLPAELPEALQPITASIRGQQVAMCTALARGLDPDAPPGLSKVTLTR